MKPKPFTQWLADNEASPEPLAYPLCPRCDGGTRYVCKACGGTGNDEAGDSRDGRWPYCETCGGEGHVTCARCHGRGDDAWRIYMNAIRCDTEALSAWNARVTAP